MNELLEVASSTILEIDLQDMLKFQHVGVYNSVEVTEIFALPSKKVTSQEAQPPVNIFTIMVAEVRNLNGLELDKESLIWLKMPSVKKFRIGIKTYMVSIEKAIEMLVNANEAKVWDSCGKVIDTPPYFYKGKFFTPADSAHKVSLNSILKNNFDCGSYIIELQNKGKEGFTEIFNKPSDLQTLANQVLMHFPIDIAPLSDRLGNIVLQIPTNAIQVQVLSPRDTDHIECKIAWHPSVQRKKLMFCGRQEDTDYNQNEFYILEGSDSVTIPFKQDEMYRLTILDSLSNLILYSSAPSSFIKKIGINIDLAQHKQRIINHADGSQSKISLVTTGSHSVVGDNLNSFIDWTEKRIYENNRAELKRNREFVQYNPKSQNIKQAHKKALEDIQYLIRAYGENGVYLWDPYLSPNDIIQTLFHSKHSLTKLRAITNLKEPQEEKAKNLTKDKRIDDYSKQFEALPPETRLGINLQFKTPQKNYGWSFHDRFLIFPNFNDKPLAWSLGTSLNSFGKEHHIMQKCSDPQLIVDAFNELWEAINQDECLIWSSK